MHSVSQRPNLRHLGEAQGGVEGLLEAVSFKKTAKSMGRGRVANASWEFQTVWQHHHHIVTYSTLLNRVGDLVKKLSRHPELANETVPLDVNIEHVDVMVDGLHLTHFTHPHVHVL